MAVASDEEPLLLLRVEEAAQRLGIGRSLMYRLVLSGAVESVPVGRPRRIPTECFREYGDRLRSEAAGLTRTAMASRRPNGASSVYLGSDGSWHGRVTVGFEDDGSPDRRHVRGSTEAAVVRKVRTLEKQRELGAVPTSAARWTVATWLEHWLENIARPGLRYRSYDAYRIAVRRHLVPNLGQHRLDRLGHVTQNAAALPKAPRVEVEEIEPYSVDEVCGGSLMRLTVRRTAPGGLQLLLWVCARARCWGCAGATLILRGACCRPGRIGLGRCISMAVLSRVVLRPGAVRIAFAGTTRLDRRSRGLAGGWWAFRSRWPSCCGGIELSKTLIESALDHCGWTAITCLRAR
jgi:excisionase family DNA binding protein